MVTKLGKKAVLVYPHFDQDSFWSIKKSMEKYVQKGEFGLPKRATPPLGLMGLFGHLKPFYDKVVLIDRNIDPRKLIDLIKDADHVYMGGMVAQENSFIQDAKIVKSAGKILIAGGTVVSKKSPLMDIADHLVENEAEMVIDDLLEGLSNGTAKKFYTGLPATPDKFFRPDFSSINQRNYFNMAIQVVRGCPEACEFCDITARFGKKPRVTPFEYTADSLKQMYNLGIKMPVFIVDDNFIGNPQTAIEVLKNIYQVEENLGRKGFHFSKYTELSMRLAQDSENYKELRYWLRKTNFTAQFIGVETNNEAALQETGKRQNLQGKNNRSAIENLEFISRETGSALRIGMIHGFDSDTRESAKSLIDFCNEIPSPYIMVSLLAAMPNTKLGERLTKEGRLKEFASGNNSDGRMNFIPYNFSAKEAEEDYVNILEELYDENAFFSRVMKELELIDSVNLGNKFNLKTSVYSLSRILTKDNALTFWKNLPKAHNIAKERFGLGTPGYLFIVSNYFQHCAAYTHFKAQTDILSKHIKERDYDSWQLYSWKDMQESPIVSVDIIEGVEAESSLYERVKMRLENGYEFIGTRAEALSQFVEPYLKKGLQDLKDVRMPSFEQFKSIEVKAYLMAHMKRPQILQNIDFSKVEEYIGEALHNQAEYIHDMKLLLNNVMNTNLALENVR